MPKKKVLVLYEYFYPGFNAGGPVQSLINLILLLEKEIDFYVLTTAFDLNAEVPYPDTEVDIWHKKSLPSSKEDINIYYCSTPQPSYSLVVKAIKQVNTECFYLNGIFSSLVRNTLIYHTLHKKLNITCILSPRGMLLLNALRIKQNKKKIYINLLMILGCFKNKIFHATTVEEFDPIKRYLNNRAVIKLVGNVPKKPVEQVYSNSKTRGSLNLVFVALISPIKGLDLLIDSLMLTNQNISLTIYGPIKDPNYWKICLDLIKKLPTNVSVSYKGNLDPSLVQNTLRLYDAKILLTKGENFCHSLYESLSVGTPIITSFFTPWNNLDEKSVGWNVDIYNLSSIAKLLDSLAQINETEWMIYKHAAISFAKTYYYESDFITKYKQLFS